jgi:hypothetical protein
MNTLEVVTPVTASAAGVVDQAFVPGDIISPWSPFYWNLLWSGNAVDTGNEDAGDAIPLYKGTYLVISEENPHLAPGGVWIQDLGDGDWTMWFEE